MRDYARAEPKMWHGATMKALRKSPEGLVVALYLMTSPSSNMLGLFGQPILYMAYETGLGEEGARKGLRSCIEAGYCSYDDESEVVWVHEMAKYQIAPELKASDLRCKGIQKEYDSLPENPFLAAFFERYGAAFHMSKARGFKGATQAPCKPLRSQEQEQEQEQAGSFDLLPESQPAPQPVSDIRIPLNDGTEHAVLLSDIAEWSATYPAVDVEGELRKMRTWVRANPTKRKTARGVTSFIVKWLGKTQDNPGAARSFGAQAVGGGGGMSQETYV